MKRTIKSLLSTPLSLLLRSVRPVRESFRRLSAHAFLGGDLATHLPASAVVLGRISVLGTRRIHIGENALLYPGVHLETQGEGTIEVGDDVVISRGAHIVAMASVVIGRGSLIGEYTSIRDANHTRDGGCSIRDSAHAAKPISLGEEVWIGRGVAVLAGVTIGDRATVGANAVVTKDVAADDTVAGIPAVSITGRPQPSLPR